MGSNLHMKCTLVACHLPALMLLHLPLHFLYDFDLNLDATYCCTSKLTVDRKTLKAYVYEEILNWHSLIARKSDPAELLKSLFLVKRFT